MIATHFRAYAQASAQKSFTTTDEDGNAVLDRKGRPVRASREWPIEAVAFTGATTDDKAEFDAGDVVVTRVVFLSLVPHAELVASHEDRGLALSLNPDDLEPDGAEIVVGCVNLGASGAISVACPDPDED